MEIKSEKEFNDIINGNNLSNEKKLVVVDFYATWCAPCKRFAPEFKKLEKEYGKHILFAKMNIEENEEIETIVDKCKIKKLPTFMFFDIADKSSDCDDSNDCKYESKYEQVYGPGFENKLVNRLKYFNGLYSESEDDDF